MTQPSAKSHDALNVAAQVKQVADKRLAKELNKFQWFCSKQQPARYLSYGPIIITTIEIAINQT